MFDWRSFLKSIDAPQWAQSVAVVFALLLLYSIYSTVRLFIDQRMPATTTQTSSPVTPLPDIAAWHLFGKYTAIKAALLPKTQLHLLLQGIFFTKDAQQSQAIIAEPGKPAKVYHQGQTISGGAIIKEILAEGVVLELGGELQWLPLKEFRLHFAPQPTGNLPDSES